MKIIIIAIAALVVVNFVSAQENEQGSVIQNLTPSKLIGKGQMDIKWFNNLYTETEDAEGRTFPRQNFFTSTLEIYRGISKKKRINLGLILEFRSNTVGADALSALEFKNDPRNGTRSGLTSIAPSIKFQPFANIGNFSIQSSLFLPLSDKETIEGVFLDQDGFTWQNKFFLDHTFTGDKFQLFAEVNLEYHFGKNDVREDSTNSTIRGSFANNSLGLTPGIFLSYFPTSKFTVLALGQYSQRFDLGSSIEQNYTAVGGGVKYQLTNALNIEALYTKFIAGENSGLGNTFNLGFRLVK